MYRGHFLDRYPDTFTFWRNIIVAIISGSIFMLAWWIFIDACVIYPTVMKDKPVAVAPGILSTIGLICVQLTPYKRSFYGYYIREHQCSLNTLRTILFIAFMLSFSALSWAMYIWIIHFLFNKEMPQWPGIAIFIQNLLILTSNMIYKFLLKDLRNEF